MNVNVNQPSFISFLETMTNNILSSIKIDNYFSLTSEKKLTISFTVLNLIKNSSKIKANITDNELKALIVILWKRHEEKENYEFAAVLDDTIKNFDKIKELTDSVKKPVKKKKINPQ